MALFGENTYYRFRHKSSRFDAKNGTPNDKTKKVFTQLISSPRDRPDFRSGNLVVVYDFTVSAGAGESY